MNEFIAVLERKGLIKRKEAAEHKRILRVTITLSGSLILAECNKVVDKLEHRHFSCFSRKEQTLFRDLLVKYLQARAQDGEAQIDAEAVGV